jgi:NADPH-dependent 7-cyano-7-deazaguanine reductase QueF
MTICILLSMLIFSCKKDPDEQGGIDYMKFKRIAWNSLSQETKNIVLHDWRDAETIKTKNPDNNEDVVIVVFHTPNDALTCPISVYVDIKTEEVIYPENIFLCD